MNDEEFFLEKNFVFQIQRKRVTSKNLSHNGDVCRYERLLSNRVSICCSLLGRVFGR